jgi:hypothetical protein
MWGRARIATVPQLAARYSLSTNAMHKALDAPEAPKPIDPPPVDARTPTRYVVEADRYMGHRPGKGSPGKPRGRGSYSQSGSSSTP